MCEDNSMEEVFLYTMTGQQIFIPQVMAILHI